MTRVRTFTLLMLLAFGVAVAEDAPGPGPPAAPPLVGGPDETGLFRHTGKYPPLEVTWRGAGVEGVVAVFPHPVLARRVVLATRSGLLISEDAGETWAALPQAAADRVGVVRHVEFSPEAPDTFYLASDHRGVWATDDAGKTVRPIGTRQAGLASDDTVAVYVYPGDRRLRTLMAIHGEAAPGISVTADAGGSWRTMAADFHVRDILCGNPGDEDFFAVAARTRTPDLLSIYHAVSLDDYWMELVKDVVPTGADKSVLARQGQWSLLLFRGCEAYFSTADDGLYRVGLTGGVRTGPAALRSFASVGFTWGRNADTEVLFAYEPRKFGMLATVDGFETMTLTSAGLYTGALVKEGAHIRAGATGRDFYAAVNGRLYVGRRGAGAVAVTGSTVTPAILGFEQSAFADAIEGLREDLGALRSSRVAADAARKVLERIRGAQRFLSAGEIAVTAKVASASGPPKSVTVDLSRLGGLGLAPMADDGAHGDGAAGDGVYGAVLRLDPRRFKVDHRDRRCLWPGKVGLTVTAVAADGTLDGEVAVLSVFNRLESFQVVRECPPIEVAGEPWSRSFGPGYETRDITYYHALTFRIRADREMADEVRVQLQDSPAFSLAVTTPPVPLLAEGFIAGGKVTGEWQAVVVPIKRLRKDAPDFRPARWLRVVLSGEGTTPGTYSVQDMRFLLSPEEAKAVKGDPPR